MLDPFAATEPHLSGAELLRRLNAHVGAHFTSNQLRTVQRLCKAWRRDTACKLINATELPLTPDLTVVRSPALNPPPAPPDLGNIVT